MEKKPPVPEVVRPAAVQPAAVAPRRERIPRDDQCGPELDLRKWAIQCQSENLAMMCLKKDRTDRRCARIRGGKYRWTYGSFCAHALACYKRACN